jgi:hypothetical protein
VRGAGACAATARRAVLDGLPSLERRLEDVIASRSHDLADLVPAVAAAASRRAGARLLVAVVLVMGSPSSAFSLAGAGLVLAARRDPDEPGRGL